MTHHGIPLGLLGLSGVIAALGLPPVSAPPASVPTRSLERSFAWALDVELVSGSLAVRYGDDDEMVIELERVSYREERAIELLDESLEPEDGAPPRLRRSFVSVTGKAVVRDLDDGTLHAEVSFR